MSRESDLLVTLRHDDADRVDEVFPSGRRAEILATVLAADAGAHASPRAATQRWFSATRITRRLPHLALAGACACALAAGVVAILAATRPAAHPAAEPLHASVVSFRYPLRGADRGFIVATVTDPDAAQNSLDAAFKAAGLDISISLVPASPSAVGTVVEISEPSSGPQIETLDGGPCVTGGGGPGACPIGLRIPRDFTGSGSVTLGRPAKPGEDYESSNSAFAPGEQLHCSGVIGDTLAVAAPKLAALGVAVRSAQSSPAPPSAGAPAGTSASPSATATSTNATTTTATTTSAAESASTQAAPATAGGAASGGQFVVDGTPISAGLVMLQTQTQPLSPSQLAASARMYDAGC